MENQAACHWQSDNAVSFYMPWNELCLSVQGAGTVGAIEAGFPDELAR